ncbi:MAG: helix-turn-helix domain-containing protein [Treponema sp.]|jgi:transcriptional regulator with XRE-family HTH domain|nr:helix-turn-helix domain-containing protein [Treponema sp.]
MQGRKNSQFDIAVNQRVKEVRLAMNLTQTEFCEKILHSHGHYAEIELCRRPANKRTLSMICTAYGVSEQYLNTGEGPMFTGQIDQKMEEAAQLFRGLQTEFQDIILRHMREMVKITAEKRSFYQSGA